MLLSLTEIFVDKLTPLDVVESASPFLQDVEGSNLVTLIVKHYYD